jgi:hypothetical protein
LEKKITKKTTTILSENKGDKNRYMTFAVSTLKELGESDIAKIQEHLNAIYKITSPEAKT